MKISVALAAGALFGAHALFGSIIPIGAVPSSGAGLGAVNTVLTFTSPANTTTESGCVAAGMGGAVVTGPTACAAGFTGGNEQAQNHVYSATSLGLTDFNNLQIIFNASEPGNAPSISLDNLALTLWDPATGLIIDARYTTGPYAIANAFPGVGNAGYGFMLDSTQAGDLNSLLAAFPNMYLGLDANASDATGGLETLSFRVTSASAVPEPAAFGLVGLALASLGIIRRRRKV